jgi:hypothetical protein
MTAFFERPVKGARSTVFVGVIFAPLKCGRVKDEELRIKNERKRIRIPPRKAISYQLSAISYQPSAAAPWKRVRGLPSILGILCQSGGDGKWEIKGI